MLYFSRICGDAFREDYKKLKKYPHMVGSLFYHSELTRGFDRNGDRAAVYSLVPYSRGETGRFYYRRPAEFLDGKYEIRYFPYIGFPVLRELSRFLAAFRYTWRWAGRTKGSPRAALIALNNYLPVSLGCILACKIRRIPACSYIHDSTVDLYSPDYIAGLNPLKRVVLPLYMNCIRFAERRFDGYIYVAQGMSETVNFRRRPELTVEGVYDPVSLSVTAPPRQNALLYAGSLHRKYGIGKILDVFSALTCPAPELWICGAGEMEAEVRAACERNPRIRFFGFLPREKVLELEASARLLLNLRDPSLPYTRRSFPSKVMEYMLSGTPLFTTRITGIPREYYAHVFSVDGFDTEHIAETINSALSRPQNELDIFAAGARQFVRRRAGGDAQAKRISDFLQSPAVQGRSKEKKGAVC